MGVKKRFFDCAWKDSDYNHYDLYPNLVYLVGDGESRNGGAFIYGTTDLFRVLWFQNRSID